MFFFFKEEHPFFLPFAERMTNPTPRTNAPLRTDTDNHGLRRALGLPDLVSMQILLVVGTSWTGYAARQGSAQVAFWLLGVVTFFLPAAFLIQFCVRIWPIEGGVYQWTRHGIGPFAGFMSAWNFGAWAVLLVANIGTLTATSIHYVIGASAAWMENSTALIIALNAALLGFMLAVNVLGLRIGRWVAHFGTTVFVAVILLAQALLLVHHPETHRTGHALSPAFAWHVPVLTLIGMNLFAKLTFQGLTGLEQVAVFAGETRNPARSILRSAWIAAPLIAVIYITLTGALLTYTPADEVDLNGPIPQLLAAAFGDGTGAMSPAHLVGVVTNVFFAVAAVAQYVVIVAETSRLPMVAAWDHLLPAAFTRLHPRFRTPTLSLVTIVAIAFAFSVLASVGANSDEAFQVMSVGANVGYGINYVLMFAVPLVAGTRWSPRPDLRPGLLLRVACVSAIAVTLASIAFAVVPVVPVANEGLFAAKVAVPMILINALGIYLYWRGARRQEEGKQAVLF
jgi:amino acid transporter